MSSEKAIAGQNVIITKQDGVLFDAHMKSSSCSMGRGERIGNRSCAIRIKACVERATRDDMCGL